MADFTPTPRAAASIVTGLRGPEQHETGIVIPDVQDVIVHYQPDAVPFQTLITRIRDKKSTTQYRFDWIEADEYPRELELTGAALVADTTLDVTAGDEARVAANYILLNTRTGEQVSVDSTSSGVVTVTRDIGDTGQVDMVAGDRLVFTRPVYEDGADVGTLKTQLDTLKFNYTETIRTPFGFTGRDIVTELYGGRDPKNKVRTMSVEHRKSIELAAFTGARRTITGTHIRSLTGGVKWWINSNVWDISSTGTVSERAFVEFLEEGMRWGKGGHQNGSGIKYLFCSRRWLTEINFWGHDRIRFKAVDKELGLNFAQYESPHGKVFLVPTPTLDQAMPDSAFLLDLNHIRYRFLQERDTRLLKDRGGNGIDGETHEYMTDFGLQVELEASHSYLKGLNA